jgi:hypothetical protein
MRLVTGLAEVLDDLAWAELRLRRAWPRSAEHLLLDLDDPSSEGRVAGQWFADRATATRVAGATVGAERRGRVVLQPHGADRKLTALASLVRRPDSRLIAHRPERRAVVVLDGGSAYAKLVPRRKIETLRHRSRRAARLPIRTPALVDCDTGDMVITKALPGVPLPELLTGPRAEEALTVVGTAVARLHRCAPPAGSSLHGPADEVAVTEGWERWARAYGLPPLDAVRDAPSYPPPPPTLRLIHRDLHDGQFLLSADADGRLTADGVGLLDFDLMAAGDPALDLGNLVEHLYLRARQGTLSDPDSARNALLAGYDPDDATTSRIAAYRTLTARRLTALYAFRVPNLVT